MKDELLFCPLGGSGEIGMNMNLYAYGKPENQKWIIVDIGVTFADDIIPGIDLMASLPFKSSFINIGCIRSAFDNVVSASISLKAELFLILRILVSGYDLSIFIIL